MQDAIKLSQQKSKKLKAVVSGHQELVAKEKRISEELTKNIYLQRELDKLKLEWMRETWLLKNDLHNLKGQLQAPGTTQRTEEGAPRQALSSLEYFHLTIYLEF
jgi:uncharacterized protein (DUF3084 family)